MPPDEETVLPTYYKSLEEEPEDGVSMTNIFAYPSFS